VKTLKDFYGPFQKEVKEKDKLDKATTLEKADPKYKCPKCGSPMVVKLGRGGKFLSCERYPDCDGALTIEGIEIKADEPIGNDPETGLPIYTKVGRFGPYVQLGDLPPKKAKVKAARDANGKLIKKTPEERLAAKEEKERLAKIGKPKMASIPKEVDPTTVTVEMALKYLSLPRTLGQHPDGKDVTAAVGRFGPYASHDGNFRSIKPPLDVYTITLEQALELLAQEKKPRGFQKKK
jgi:DNA topoisomerase-1